MSSVPERDTQRVASLADPYVCECPRSHTPTCPNFLVSVPERDALREALRDAYAEVGRDGRAFFAGYRAALAPVSERDTLREALGEAYTLLERAQFDAHDREWAHKTMARLRALAAPAEPRDEDEEHFYRCNRLNCKRCDALVEPREETTPCPSCDNLGFQAGAHTERVEPCPSCKDKP